MNTVTFEGNITEIGPRKSQGYEPGERAELHIQFHIEGKRSWYDNTGIYPIYADVFTADGIPIVVSKPLLSCNFDFVWKTSKEWDKTRNISLGSMPEERISGYLVLTDYELNELDRQNFYIPVKGEIPEDEEEEKEKFPWLWLVIGGGIAVTAIAISAAK